MKLALGASWLVCVAAAVRAAPTPAHLGTPPHAPPTYDAGRTDEACAAQSATSLHCLLPRQDSTLPSSPPPVPASTPSDSLSSTSTSVTSSTDTTSSSAHAPLSFTTTLSSPVQVQSNQTSNSGSSSDQLRTIGIIGGLLAGIALIAIICIILILIRIHRRRGSLAPSSIRSRTRSNSRQQQPPPPFQTMQVGEPIMRPGPLRINTGDLATLASHDYTTAGTLGHHEGLHPFPISGHESASSHTTSFGNHSASTGHMGSQRRPPQIPSLGLSQPRPLLRSFGSIISYHASTGHLSAIVQEDHTQASIPAAPSTTGSKTVAITEDADRTEDTARTTEESRTMPVEQSHEPSPKPE